jgi:hypothetical protein
MIEQLEANFNQFYRDNIKDHLKECDGDLEMAEEALEDVWVEYILEGGRFNATHIAEII